MSRPDPTIESKVRTSIRALNETLQYNANEPSVALYRIQVRTNEIIFFANKNF